MGSGCRWSIYIYIPVSSGRDPFGGFIRDLFRGENVTSIWVISLGHLEEAGIYIYMG